MKYEATHPERSRRGFAVPLMALGTILGGTGFWSYDQYVLPQLRLRNYREMLQGFCDVRDATARIPDAAELPDDLASLARPAPGPILPPDVIAADFNSPRAVPFHGYCFRLLRSSEPKSRTLGLVAIPSSSSTTFGYMFLWTGSTHVRARFRGIVPTRLPTDHERRTDWSTWCD